MKTAQELVALSVSALEAELKAETYTAEVITEAMQLEAEGDNRKTALEAYTAMLEEPEVADNRKTAMLEEPEAADKYVVKAGKALTSKRGVLSDKDEVKVEYLEGGQTAFDELVKKGFIVKA